MKEKIEMFKPQNSTHDSSFNENVFQYSNLSVYKAVKSTRDKQ
jgi:hypothetical protein